MKMKGFSKNVLETFAGAIAVLALSFSCASVPKDAPQEFHAARAGIDKAEDDKVQKVLPNTMDKAESEFSKALSMWKDAKNEKSPEKAEAMKDEATKIAEEVGTMTSGATELTQNIASWDQDFAVLEGQYSIPALVGQVRGLRDEMVRDEDTISSPFAKVASLKFQGPVAYFDTAQSTLDSYYQPAITEVASLLKLDPNLIVTISGYADVRGPTKYNEDLSRRRAETVANILDSNGITGDRVVIAPMGESLAHYKNGAAKLQLERRVDVTVSVKPANKVSH
jgi:outer membrane protein OmpA-like peptidoglycan-associated protein